MTRRSGGAAAVPAPARKTPMEPTREELFTRLLRIRYLEDSLLALFSKGALFGTTHTSIGQEAVAVAVLEALDLTRDVVFSSHRCHGHFLAYGGDPTALLAEIMGRADGVCGGMGGSQHLHLRNFYSNGIQGGITPLSVGAALAERRRGSGAIATVFIGDGTLGEGVVYESLNMASLWSAPTLFVLEDNRFAQSTPKELGVAGSMTARATAFGIDADAVETNDVEVLLPLMRDRVRRVREGGRPFFQVVHTYRLSPHSKGDDHRDEAEIAAWREKDPIRLVGDRLPAERREALDREARREIEAAITAAEGSAWPEASSLPVLVPLDRSRIPGECPTRLFAQPDVTGGVSVARELNAAHHALMEADDRVVLIGEDLLDPYGGAFKISKGLSTRFPDRVMTTPISEAGLVGVANGMALRGLRPIAEIMFGDFVALAADQIVNHAAKFHGMYNGRVDCPVTIRTPMGGRRGYGPTHSQSLESLLLGASGLEVVAVSRFHPVGRLLHGAVLHSDRPTLFVENKLLYAKPVQLPDARGRVGIFSAEMGEGLYPTLRLRIDAGGACDVVLVAHGGSADLAMEAAERLMVEHEVACDVVVPAQLCPLPIDDLLDAVLAAGRAVVVEESIKAWGWGAEVAAALHERAGSRIGGGAIARVGARTMTIPVSRPLEDCVLPQVQDIVDTALELL